MSKRQAVLKLLLYVVFVLGSLTTGAWADSWTPAEITTTCSANQKYCLKVYPFEHYPKQDCHAVLTAMSSDKPLWEKKLLNFLAPGKVFVSNDGKRVVTIDDWGPRGHSDHVVAIYGPDGEVLRQFALKELMTADDIHRYTYESISSRHWGLGHYFIPEKNWLVLRVFHDSIPERQERENGVFLNTVLDINQAKVLWSDMEKSERPKLKHPLWLWVVFSMLSLGCLFVFLFLRKSAVEHSARLL